ncbi:hypothetical protein TWF694_007237 [Orbilia ellipsospora]|uniref:RBR-type E3 ubiquitin transferase n=1 Tax=Orbilia ellipsospora TaxID=2528407 RepID=A0AAV9XHJ6_9PEZI
MDFGIIDLTASDDEFEQDTKLLRSADRERREAAIVLDDSGNLRLSVDSDDNGDAFEALSTPTPHPIMPSSIAANSTSSDKPPAQASSLLKTPSKVTKPKSRKTNTKKPPTPSKKYQKWRASGIEFEDIEPISIPTPLTAREKLKRKKEAEEKEISERIQSLAASVGWSQPRRQDQRTVKKNSTATPYRYIEERQAECDICGDKMPLYETTKLNCKHRHCNSCLQQNFQMVVENPVSWPARCCKPLDHNLASAVLPPAEFNKFLDVKKEKEGMSSTSCYGCGELVPRTDIIGGSSAFCAKCDRITCVHCAKAQHEGACMLDPETEKLLQVAKGKKWSKCPSCSNMVERNQGCNHMSCRCGAHFCYKCGRRLGECNGRCEQIEFQPNMWKDQGVHKPVQTTAKMIEEYRQRSQMAEVSLQEARVAMSEENSKNLEKYQVLSEIASLRAKLEKKKGDDDESPSKVSSFSASMVSPVQSKTSIGMEGFRKAFPELMKMMEEKKKEVVSEPTAIAAIEDASKAPTLMDRFRKSFPALFNSTSAEEPATPQISSNTEVALETNQSDKYPDPSIGVMDLTGDDDETDMGIQDDPWGLQQDFDLDWDFRDFFP